MTRVVALLQANPMDPVSNVDRLVFLLRDRLGARMRAAPGSALRPATGERPPPSIDSLQALAALEGVDDRRLRRALIQNVLADQFGGDLLNDARFQQIVDRVTETLEQDTAGLRLLDRVVTELREAAG